MVDEFPLFCARDQTSLARILSECRKYRLHLGLAHQTIAQLPGQRIQGALENAKLKVIFGTGRQTAEAIARELYMPDPKAIKHEVIDEAAKERTHPVFSALNDQFEVFTQSVQQLRQRRALVKLPDKSIVAHVRIPEVPASRLTAGQLDSLKQAQAKDIGSPCHVLEEQIARRAARNGGPFHLPQPLLPAWGRHCLGVRVPLCHLRPNLLAASVSASLCAICDQICWRLLCPCLRSVCVCVQPRQYKEILRQTLVDHPELEAAVAYFRELMDLNNSGLRERHTGSFANKLLPFLADPTMPATFAAPVRGVDWDAVTNKREMVIIDFQHEKQGEK